VEVPEALEIIDPTDPDTTAEIGPIALNFVFTGPLIGLTITQDLTIMGNTTDVDGFTVSMSTIGLEQALTNTDPGIAATINPTAGGSASLSANTWGYFAAYTTNYLAVPASNAPVAVFATALAGSATETLTFGVNVDSTLPAGVYSNTIIFTIAANL